jgi:teichuronic acid biosynthesis glycosyltransferase TuaC
MRILAVTNMYPIETAPTLGIFVEQQVKGLIGIGLQVDVLHLNRREFGPQVYWRTTKRIEHELQKHPYDMMHVMYGGVMAEVATRTISHLPNVVTIHGSDLLGDSLSGPIRRLSAQIGVLASRLAARRADGVVTVSECLRDELPRNVDRSKVRVIPCGIDLDRFTPLDQKRCRRELGWDDDGYHVLFAISSDPVKRPELARGAIAALRERGTKVQLHELSRVPNEQVPVWINASDALLLTSLHEGSPTIVKESLACNVPVVSVDVGDVRERIKGVDGCSIVPANPADLATALLDACSARGRSNGRNRVQELSLRATAERLRDFYQEIITRKKRLN